MSGGIFLLRDDKHLVRMAEQSYDSEALLQTLLVAYPDLLAGDQIDSEEPRRWLLIRREASIPFEEGGADRLSLDHLFVDQDGVPTLVEVKRSGDTRIRREVVGQMLDYAANLSSYWPVERLKAELAARCEAEGKDVAEVMGEAFGDDTDVTEYWDRVKTCLLARKMRLLFVADQIPRELRRIVEFLNETMDPVEVLALEIRQYTGEQHKALVPRIIGQTASMQQKKGDSAGPRTNKEAFVAALAESAQGIYARLLDFATANQLLIRWGSKGFSMNVVLGKQNVSILEGYSSGAFGSNMYFPLKALSLKLREPEPVVAWYQGALEKLGVMRPTRSYLVCSPFDLDTEKEHSLYEILVTVVQMIREHGLAT